MDAVRVEKNPKVAARWVGQSLLRFGGLLAIFGMVAGISGCSTFGRPQRSTTQQVMMDAKCPVDSEKMPAKELAKITLPPYVIEPPDILLIDALRVVPKPPFRIQSFDTLQVIVEGTLLEQPINGLYVVEPGGMLDLGPSRRTPCFAI